MISQLIVKATDLEYSALHHDLHTIYLVHNVNTPAFMLKYVCPHQSARQWIDILMF